MGMIIIMGKELQVGSGITIEQAILDNGYHPDSFLYMIDGRPVPMDTVIGDPAVVKAIRVASGG
ncbi:MAG: hypothetical protein E7Z64_01670 [Thermoplasmata archaeon]|jgi:sulfur carrier protein|nr:hypothetical protein [Thermoplasmata archaeon]